MTIPRRHYTSMLSSKQRKSVCVSPRRMGLRTSSYNFSTLTSTSCHSKCFQGKLRRFEHVSNGQSSYLRPAVFPLAFLNRRRRLWGLGSKQVTFPKRRHHDSDFVAQKPTCRNGEDLYKTVSNRVLLLAMNNLHVRSISSRVSCLVSRTKQKIISQAIRFRPA